VQPTCGYVHAHVTFIYGSSNPWTTATDVDISRLGVCRDFTHLAISFCRRCISPSAASSATCPTSMCQ